MEWYSPWYEVIYSKCCFLVHKISPLPVPGLPHYAVAPCRSVFIFFRPYCNMTLIEFCTYMLGDYTGYVHGHFIASLLLFQCIVVISISLTQLLLPTEIWQSNDICTWLQKIDIPVIKHLYALRLRLILHSIFPIRLNIHTCSEIKHVPIKSNYY